MLNFDLQQQRWRWDITVIDAKGIADNVVDLMLGKMALLPVETQSMIQLAACVGSRFSLEVLAKVAEQPLATVTRCLCQPCVMAYCCRMGRLVLGWCSRNGNR